MSVESSGVPFPSMDDMDDMPEIPALESSSPTPEPIVISATDTGSPVQSNTSSSKLTSSDKLSTLPPPTRLENANVFSHPLRSPDFSSVNFNRGWRRSLDAVTSFPAFFGAGHGPPTLNHDVWARPSNALGVRRSIHQSQGSLDDSLTGGETPRQRISYDGDRSTPTARPTGQAFPRSRGSDPSAPSPLRTSPFGGRRDREELAPHPQQISSQSPSQSRSRAASPLRILQQLSSGFHRHRSEPEEPFVPVDPFRFKSRFPLGGQPPRPPDDIEMGASASSGAYDCDDLLPVDSMRSLFYDSRLFITDILPREIYLNFLLRLPAMYFSRVARIFEDANVSKPDILRMINTSGGSVRQPSGVPPIPVGGSMDPNLQTHGAAAGVTSGNGFSAQVGPGAAPAAAALMHMPLPFPDEWTPPLVSPALIRFKHSWEAFIDSLVKEWKTLNVVSALLASAIMTIFQVPDAAGDPVTRTLALLSLISSLFSLSYGCMYIVRFGMMRSMFHASRWAEQAQKTKTLIWWNVWVLLAMPVVWMAWSMLLFISAILSFVWRTGSVLDPANPSPLGPRLALALRILITSAFALGMIYLCMIIKTLKKYGSHQSSTKAILLAGLTTNTRTGIGSPREMTHKLNVDDDERKLGGVDDEMTERGRSRERERSRSAHKKSGKHKIWSLRDTGRKEHGSRRGALGPLFGFGVGTSKSHSGDGLQDVEVELDLKSQASVVVEALNK
ncbi:hypothetical protein CPB84DRAFT_562685 [Gymnopilus junonius]|uniref:Uncharacterized protein n=1 Tax=Gymnopilus junonius TaxID=109634 RepID=A0A9P5NVL7_GYMJU|nr:hypothetical protein CPB84DRAFT_562685 [Gymnopilus junonius]